MSFKRLEDDSSWLQNLQQRRVSELLSNDVPEDEALLMKNGKFACLVCANRPVLDTVAIMTIHRNGKKHLANLKQFEANKREIDALRKKRQHEEYVKLGKVREVAEKKSVSLMASLGPAYDPRVKKQKKGHAVEKLNASTESCHSISTKRLDSTTSSINTDTEQTPEICGTNQTTQSPRGAAGDAQLPVKSKLLTKDSANLPQTIFNYRKAMAEEDRLTRIKLKPYVSKRPKMNCTETRVNYVAPSNSTVQNDLPVCGSSTHNNLLPNQLELRTEPSHLQSKIASSSTLKSYGASKICSHIIKSVLLRGLSTVPSVTSKSSEVKPKICVDSKRELTQEKRLAGERYLKATESGWKRDRGGNWIKDESVEFDSDEEPPDIP